MSMIEEAKELDAYGVWHVTTEGDCEGRSTRDLGVHEGYLDEIAFDLALQAGYTLTFNPSVVDRTELVPSLAEQVNVALDISTRTWDMKPQERAGFFMHILRSRPVQIEPSSFYAAVTLKRVITPEKRAQVEAGMTEVRCPDCGGGGRHIARVLSSTEDVGPCVRCSGHGTAITPIERKGE